MSNPNNSYWQCIDSGFHSGKYNMDFDLSLVEKLQQNEIQPTLRIYGWKPWSISLGYNQSENDIDINKCKEYGFEIVRRPTGGRAILHANEVTYSVVMFAENRGITEIYSLISKALVSGLRKICAGVSYETSQPNFQTFYKKQESVPCFSASARYEVQINGRKLVGSAQRRFSKPGMQEVVLQHGSILLGSEHKLLAEVVNIEDDNIKKKIVEDIENKTIDLSSALKRNVSFEEIGLAIRTGFEQELNIQFENSFEVTL